MPTMNYAIADVQQISQPKNRYIDEFASTDASFKMKLIDEVLWLIEFGILPENVFV
jgi:hypothetical protein